MDYDALSVDDFMGEVTVPLNILKSNDNEDISINMSKYLQSQRKQSQDKGRVYGQLLVSLNYNSSTEKLIITALKAHGLRRPDGSQYGDVYVKIYLFQPGEQGKPNSYTTNVSTLSGNDPVWNEGNAFEVKSTYYSILF